jgi:hypothetical protein
VSKLGPGVRLNFATGTYSCSGLFIQDIKGGTERPASLRSSDGPRLAKFDCAGSGGVLFNFVQGFIVEGIELYNSSHHGIHASPLIEKGQLSNVSTDNWDEVCWKGNPNMGAY